MERKILSRSYQENLIINLVEQLNEIGMKHDTVAASKKALVSMRYFMTNFILDNDIIDEMSVITDKIMERLNMGTAMSVEAPKAYYSRG